MLKNSWKLARDISDADVNRGVAIQKKRGREADRIKALKAASAAEAKATKKKEIERRRSKEKGKVVSLVAETLILAMTTATAMAATTLVSPVPVKSST